MSAVESRKRARTEDGEGTRAKKRAVTEERNSPGYVNGTTTNTITSNEADEPKDSDDLEMFRKDAIYRRMKHYSREHERSQAKIAELELRRHTCEAGLAALEACWSQIVDTIQSLVRPEDLPPVDVRTEEIYDLSAHVSNDPDPIYVDRLRKSMQATQQLVTAFVQQGGKAQAVLSSEEVYTQCQRAQTQCSSLRSEVSLMRSKLKSSESEKERLREELVAAHTRIDRLQSKTVAALNNTSKSSSSPETGSGNGEVKKDEGSPTPSSPSVATPAAMNGIHAVLEAISTPVKEESEAKVMDVDTDKTVDHLVAEWQAIADVRERKIEELQQECVDLRDRVATLQNVVPSVETIQSSEPYKQLYAHARDFAVKEETRQKELTSYREEVELLTKEKQDWETELNAANEKALTELKAVIERRNTDLLRIREQRDQMQSELNERKQKDGYKLASYSEWRTLAESRGERINVLLSEVTRLKARIAAEGGDADLLTFFLQNPPKPVAGKGPDSHLDGVDQTYVHNLRTRLADAESRVSALESSLSKIAEDHPDVAVHARAETEAVQKAAKLEKRVREFESVFGHGAKDDAARRLGEEVKKLRLQEKQREENAAMMDDEFNKMIALYEAADKQAKSKILDLVAMEEKISRTLTEKAKFENKFYAAMRDKDAIENERKNALRTVEKQIKMVENLHQSETNSKLRIVQLEAQEKVLKQIADKARDRASVVQEEMEGEKAKFEAQMKWIEGVRAAYHKDSLDFEKRRTQLTRKEEQVKTLKLDAERTLQKAKEKAEKAALSLSSNASTREAELTKEVEKCMTLLQCSTCKNNMRTTVITKCMHTFCKPCIDSRISSRQRKCPACNIAFSQGEVQSLYFQ